MKSVIRYIIGRLGYQISRKHPIDRKTRDIYSRYSDYSMIPEQLFVENLKLIWEYRNVRGCVVECGVWRGGMSAGMASIFPEREFFLFDSFEGLPQAREIDGERAVAWQANKDGSTYFDNCTAEISIAEEAMLSTGVEFHLIKGWFSETLPVAKFNEPIAILRLDGDWYDSTMDCLKNLYPFVAQGGIIILDDYYTWDGCARAVHDYLSANSLTARLHRTHSNIPYLIKKDVCII